MVNSCLVYLSALTLLFVNSAPKWRLLEPLNKYTCVPCFYLLLQLMEVCKFVFLASFPQVALIDVNESAGRTLVEVLERQFGPERVLFLCCDVESEEKIKGFILSSSCSHTFRHQNIRLFYPELQNLVLFIYFFEIFFLKMLFRKLQKPLEAWTSSATMLAS